MTTSNEISSVEDVITRLRLGLHHGAWYLPSGEGTNAKDYDGISAYLREKITALLKHAQEEIESTMKACLEHPNRVDCMHETCAMFNNAKQGDIAILQALIDGV
jgi:hypothetical protein